VAALSQLAALSSRPGLGIGNGQLTIEEMVRDLLRPMLRDWLDANLPGMVERLVKDEIGRMVREAQR
jgi:cell pole-organizing protein PopZ